MHDAGSYEVINSMGAIVELDINFVCEDLTVWHQESPRLRTIYNQAWEGSRRRNVLPEFSSGVDPRAVKYVGNSWIKAIHRTRLLS